MDPGGGAPKPRRSPPFIGTVLRDKYRIERALGRGGYGIVVRATHLALDELVAIKILTDTTAGEAAWAEDAARFRREAQAAAALRSEHVVRILDVDVTESGLPFIVMEYLEGDTLHAIVHTRGPLAIEEAADHAAQILAALAEAHAAGIVHRDLKPANVLVTRGKGGIAVAKVLDFGASKAGPLDGGADGAAPLTRTGAVIGTLAYMAPEQIADAKRVDGRADLWGVGLILYELLARASPFGDPSDPSHVSAVLTKPAAPLSLARPGVPPRLEAAVMRCLAKTPDARFQTAAEVARAIAPFTTARGRAAIDAVLRAGPPKGLASAAAARARARTRRSRRRRMAIVLPLVALGVGVLVGVVVGVLFVWGRAG
jgi:serine/threonine-protein kinase